MLSPASEPSIASTCNVVIEPVKDDGRKQSANRREEPPAPAEGAPKVDRGAALGELGPVRALNHHAVRQRVDVAEELCGGLTLKGGISKASATAVSREQELHCPVT